MKIAFDAREIFGEKTGKGNFSYHLLLELMKFDSENEYILLMQNEQNIEIPANFKKLIVKKPSSQWHNAVRKKIKKMKPDIYFSPTSYIVPALTKIPSVIVVPDVVSFLKVAKHQTKATLIEKLTLKRAVKNTQRIVTISESTKEDIEKLFPSAKDKIRVVYPASPLQYGCQNSDLFRVKAQAMGLPEEYVLFVGTIEPRKNVEGMIKAYAKYREMVGEEKALPLVIVGNKGWYYDEVFKLVPKLGLSDHVIFTGYLEDEILPCMYERARCFFFPSLYEGFGLIILEAFRYDCPVITSKISSLPEVAGEAAEYIDPTNVDEMAKTLERVVTDRNLQNDLTQKGRDQLKKFNWNKTAIQVLEIFTKVNEEQS
ncbi:glycosyltransferase family 4 protein [Patescibacteria group bacterium]